MMSSPRVRIITSCVVLAVTIGIAIRPIPVRADALGDQRSFFVNTKYDREGRSTITATLRVLNQRGYFYVDDAFWSGLNQAQQNYYSTALESLAAEFNDRIYPLETQFWGSENNPGIDGDPHVTVLLENLIPGNGGYFDSIHTYSRRDAANSNEREMVVISAHALGSGFDKMFLGHEFQHLISFHQKEITHDTSEEVWLNELRSEYTATMLGYNNSSSTSNLSRRLPAFINNPSDSVPEWPNVSQDYASATIFAEYIVGRYGPGILSETLKGPLIGIASIDAWLTRNNYSERFADVYLDWMVASWRNDTTARFGYANDALRNLHIIPSYQTSVALGSEYISQLAVKAWQPVWHVFEVPESISRTGDGLRLDIIGQADQSHGIAYAVVWSDGSLQFQRVQPTQGATTGFVLVDNRTDTTPAEKYVRSVLIAATNITKQEGFVGNEPAYPLTVKASMVSRDVALDTARSARAVIVGQTQLLTDGVLIKRNNNEPETYVIRAPYKRYLRPDIIALYGHLNPSQAILLEAKPFEQFVTSNYIKGANGEKVYAVWPDGTKHWLNMTGKYFSESGRDWNSVFIVNDSELNAYKTGADITR